MFLVETVFVMTAACQAASCAAARERQQSGNPTPFAVATKRVNKNGFVVLSTDLEQAIKLDIGLLDGVSDVEVKRAANTYSVRIALSRFEYDVRQRIFSKELQLFDAFPEYYFDVTVMPSE